VFEDQVPHDKQDRDDHINDKAGTAEPGICTVNEKFPEKFGSLAGDFGK
jgi:hypothetical protein